MTDRVRLLIVDDNALLRDALRSILNADPRLEVVGQAGNGEEAIHEAERLAPQVVLLDVLMPGMSGEETLLRIKRSVPDARVIALSAFEDRRSEQGMLAAGADAYLRKSSSPAELVDGVLRVVELTTPIAPAAATSPDGKS